MRIQFTLSLLAVLFAGCTPTSPRVPLVFASDFGEVDGAVSAMKGVALGIDAELVIHDLTHEIAPFDVWEGAFRIAATAPSWPADTVFVCVVDPGVGTSRDPIALRTRSGSVFVGPDNGLFSIVASRLGVEQVRTIDVSRHLRGSSASHTFHGRDLFAVVGAGLASGSLELDEVGPELSHEIVQIDAPAAAIGQDAKGRTMIRGCVTVLDARFGNVWTNVPVKLLDDVGLKFGDFANVRLFQNDIERYRADIVFARTFGDVPANRALLYVNSDLEAALALNLGDFAKTYGVGAGTGWRIELHGATGSH